MKNTLRFCLFLFIVCSCQNGTIIKDYTISTKSDMLSDGIILFSRYSIIFDDSSILARTYNKDYTISTK